MGTISYDVAASLDGYIERSDGSFDGFEWDDDVVADFTADLGWVAGPTRSDCVRT